MSTQLIDTHCHIHEATYPLPIDEVVARADEAGVAQYICVGTSEASSRAAVEFAAQHVEAFAAVGVHPHDTQDGYGRIAELLGTPAKVVAIGVVGLDYFYSHSPREVQIAALEHQIDLATRHQLPIIFHVREAFDDFWPIFRNFKGIRGELHSFTDSRENLEKALGYGLLIGVNGISTFTKDTMQQAVFDAVPLDSLLLETDAPFLTPNPYRGRVNEPAYVRLVAKYHAARRGISLDDIAAATTANARALFALS